MRILQLVHQYPPDYVGGVELHAQVLAGELAARGHELEVFFRRSAEGSGLENWVEDGVRVWAARAGLVNAAGRFLSTFRNPSLLQSFEQVLA
ncbi:MAG: hypothetical protein ACRDIB_18530, partial [Ardenticatenaceae bacterium]